MVTIVPAEDDWADVFREFGAGIGKGYQQRSDENAIREALAALGPDATMRQQLEAITNVKTYNPENKKSALERFTQSYGLNLKEIQQAEQKRHNLEQENIAREKILTSESKNISPEERNQTIDNFIKQGYNKEEAEAITNPYVPASVKSDISRRVQAEIARGQRVAALEQQPVSQESAPVQDMSQEKAALKAEELGEEAERVIQKNAQPQKEEWPKLAPPTNVTAAELENWRKKNQDFNNKLLKETKNKTAAHTNSLIRYNRLTSLNNSKNLPEGMGRLVINPNTGEPYAVASLLGLVNKETQDFVKTMNDFLINAKDYFGSRVTNFDVQSFKSRLPTLLNTSDGRRLIIEQMKLMEELQLVNDTELENALKHYGRNANYSDIQNIVDERTQSKEDKIIDKINNLDKASDYLDRMANDPAMKDMALMQTKEGAFKIVPKNKVAEAEKRGYRRW